MVLRAQTLAVLVKLTGEADGTPICHGILAGLLSLLVGP